MLRARASHPILQGALARVVAIVPTAVGQLLATRLVLEHYGEATFNTYILAFSTMALIPLNSLGAGTAVVTAFARGGTDDHQARRVLLTALRVMAISGLGLVGVSLLLSAVGWWSPILGEGTDSGAAFGVGIAIYGLTFVPGMGQSILLGVNKNHLTIAVQAFFAPVMALGVALCLLVDASPTIVILVPSLAALLVSVANAAASSRVTKVRWLPLVTRIPRPKRFPGAQIRSLAGPALVLSITSPLALQTDRLVLSHRSSELELTHYSITVQLFAPLLAIVFAAVQPLWPAFAKSSADGTAPPRLGRFTLFFGGMAVVGAAGIVALSGPLARIVGGPDIDLGWALPITMGLLVAGQSAYLPLMMALKDEAGLRLAALLSVVALPFNLALSIALAPHLGAVGPILATLLVGTPMMALPLLVHLRRRQRLPPTELDIPLSEPERERLVPEPPV